MTGPYGQTLFRPILLIILQRDTEIMMKISVVNKEIASCSDIMEISDPIALRSQCFMRIRHNGVYEPVF